MNYSELNITPRRKKKEQQTNTVLIIHEAYFFLLPVICLIRTVLQNDMGEEQGAREIFMAFPKPWVSQT